MMDFTPQSITGMDVVREARALLGVPFKHAGVTPSGLCCSGVGLYVGKKLRQIPDHVQLPAHSSISPNPRIFLLMKRWADEIHLDDMMPGDLVVMCHGRSDVAAHVAIRSDLGLIHIFPAHSINRVAEHALDSEWIKRMIFAVRFKGVQD